ncbi:uncharacterized protein FOMMEDRAFT_152746 [Fomitiporia mediterranea MF3/22]|uniref:uncharacterized protein n=1 Tax=Fomitiporia mediterranea (strain MF3/22) TaxID=694068 RepID=UPI0004407730|nr:uncharacterized protein FOMMEDRAFT_152746 [Fomitiporia mediterranea MF3/22]EJD05437.1 hypothetical protein FOMMEDRAFT_152746 [Fomitiporia mediterranea MF3/22]
MDLGSEPGKRMRKTLSPTVSFFSGFLPLLWSFEHVSRCLWWRLASLLEGRS